MIRALLGVRFRALATGLSKGNKKSASKGMLVLLALLLLYAVGAIGFIMYLLFDSLVTPYHMLGLDWLYFAMAGAISFGFALFGSIFSTQSQMFNAKDNDLLLSMPIPPQYILLTRILPLLGMNLLFCAPVMIPAIIVYAIQVSFSWGYLGLQILSMLLGVFLVQALACLFGWLLHLALQKMNKSLGSLLFMILFLGLYFGIYSQANSILTAMAANGQKIADTMESWVWPLYAMGKGCTGSWHMPVFATICLGAFGLVYWVLSLVFLKTTTQAARASRRKSIGPSQLHSPAHALLGKELGKFLNTPVYLTNTGLGVIMMAALPVAALIFLGKLNDLIHTLEAELPAIRGLIPVFICAVESFAVMTAAISTPSVSLEGKQIWILKSMPVDPRRILRAKLGFHLIMTVPLAAVGGLCLGLLLKCSALELVFTTLLPAALACLSGLLGMVCGTKWAKLDYTNEAYPCKQSIAVLIHTFSMMGLPIVLGLAYAFGFPTMPPMVFLSLCTGLITGLCALMYCWLMEAGVRKWESLY